MPTNKLCSVAIAFVMLIDVFSALLDCTYQWPNVLFLVVYISKGFHVKAHGNGNKFQHYLGPASACVTRRAQSRSDTL